MFSKNFLTRSSQLSSVLRRGFAAPAAAAEVSASTQLVLNFTTPHAPVYTKKAVESVTLPGSSGEYGITANHSPIISELKPGVVTVNLGGGVSEKYFISGGFALTHANSVTDVSVPEAVPLADLDEAAIRAGHAEAIRAQAAAADGSAAKAVAAIEIETYSSMARAIGVTL